MLHDAHIFKSNFDKLVKYVPHLLKQDDLYDHFFKTNDFESMAILLETYESNGKKHVPFCSLQMFRTLFGIDNSESDYSVCQLQHLILLKDKYETQSSYDKADTLRKGRNLQKLFNKNQLHSTISFKEFIFYLIQKVGEMEHSTSLSTLDIEILESFAKYFKTFDERVLQSFLNNLMSKMNRTEIVGIILDCFVAKCVSHHPYSILLNHFYQDLVDSVLSKFQQCDKCLIDYLKKYELRFEKSCFHLIENCENLQTLIYLLESDVLIDLKFHEIMNVLNQLMIKDRLDVFTAFLNKHPYALKTIKSESNRIELFLHYPSNQYKHLIHNYFKSFGIVVTDRHIKE